MSLLVSIRENKQNKTTKIKKTTAISRTHRKVRKGQLLLLECLRHQGQ